MLTNSACKDFWTSGNLSTAEKKNGNGSLRKAFEPFHYNINIKRSLISNIYLEAVQITAEPATCAGLERDHETHSAESNPYIMLCKWFTQQVEK